MLFCKTAVAFLRHLNQSSFPSCGMGQQGFFRASFSPSECRNIPKCRAGNKVENSTNAPLSGARPTISNDDSEKLGRL